MAKTSVSGSSAAATSPPPISTWRRCLRASRCAPAPTSCPRRPRRGRPNSACAPKPSTVCSAADDIDIVVNLTIPAAPLRSRRAGRSRPASMSIPKSPSCCRWRRARRWRPLPRRRALRIGSAPDTFLGGAHQLARHLIDAGRVGRITCGTCFVMSHGMEHWHPEPGLLLQAGRRPGARYRPLLHHQPDPAHRAGEAGHGAVLDARRRRAPSPRSRAPARRSRSRRRPRSSRCWISTTARPIMFGASWDVWEHGHSPMELYGEDGTLYVPDPNFFGGEVAMTSRDRPVKRLPKWNHPFSVPNQKHGTGMARQLPRRGACRHGAGDRRGPAASLLARNGAACRRRHDLAS